MISIEFNFNQRITIIHANLSDPFQTSFAQFFQKTSIQPNSVYFIIDNVQIKPEEIVESYMNHFNKDDGKLKVLVYIIDKDNKNQMIVQSKDIICSECKEPCRIEIDEYHIKLFGCPNGHIISGIKIDDFQNTQKINLSSIVCEQCKIENKGNSKNQEFFICLTCKLNLCKLCKTNHNSNHNIIKYDKKNYICPKHNATYVNYCNDCSINICLACEEEHKEHKTISLVNLEPDIEKTKSRLIEIKKKLKNSKNKYKQ